MRLVDMSLGMVLVNEWCWSHGAGQCCRAVLGSASHMVLGSAVEQCWAVLSSSAAEPSGRCASLGAALLGGVRRSAGYGEPELRGGSWIMCPVHMGA